VVVNLELLEREVCAALRCAVGRHLSGVVYRCLAGEAGPDAIHDASFYMGGELRLSLVDAELFISWKENAGWDRDFSIATSTGSLFLPGADLDDFDGAPHPLWGPHIGQQLDTAEVFGSDDAPYAIILGFRSGAVAVASSWQTRIGDGDDLVVRPEHEIRRDSNLRRLWSSNASVEPQGSPPRRPEVK